MNRREKISTHFMNKELTMTLLSTGTDYDALAAAFRPIFTRIAQGAAEREQQRILPDKPIRWLKEAGFGTLRIPREKGGWGASLPQLSALLIELAQADSNLPQALRAHFAFVEDQLNQPDSAGRDRWFRRFLDGELVGSGWTEIGAVKLGEVNTRVTPAEGGWRLDGEKFYSTGALYADWIDVFARRSDTASDVIALVSTQQTGVVREDDWDGFGQRLTGSGTTRFTGWKPNMSMILPSAFAIRPPSTSMCCWRPSRALAWRLSGMPRRASNIAPGCTATATPPCRAMTPRFCRSLGRSAAGHGRPGPRSCRPRNRCSRPMWRTSATTKH
jgi:alkylation response protein AidB-like acyl-CoA dehydrogenase